MHGLGGSATMSLKVFSILLVRLASDRAVVGAIDSLLEELVVCQIQLPIAPFILACVALVSEENLPLPRTITQPSQPSIQKKKPREE